MIDDAGSSNQTLRQVSQNTDCPCCSNRMLRHFRQQQVYWFCRECWQEMPVYNLNQYCLLPSIATVNKSLVPKNLSFSTSLKLA
jgi:ribosomal protein L37AE/L43A